MCPCGCGTCSAFKTCRIGSRCGSKTSLQVCCQARKGFSMGTTGLAATLARIGTCMQNFSGVRMLRAAEKLAPATHDGGNTWHAAARSCAITTAIAIANSPEQSEELSVRAKRGLIYCSLLLLLHSPERSEALFVRAQRGGFRATGRESRV